MRICGARSNAGSARAAASAGSIFATGPTMQISHSGRAPPDARSRLDVEPLVDDAEESEPRPRERLHPPRASTRRRRRARNASRSTLLGKEVDVAMAFAARFVKARAAAEHDVRDAQQRVLALHELSRRALERRELVHAIVDDEARLELLQQRNAIGV